MTKTPNTLSPLTLINRVMSGKKEYRTEDYLQAFANLPANDLHTDKYSRFDVVELWNSLNDCKIKSRYYTMSLVRDNKIVQDNIKSKFPDLKYAWILHDKDKTENKHYHYVLIFPNPRSLKSVASDLNLPYIMIEKVRSKKGMLDYLTHENNKEKHHYSLSEIEANFDVQEEKDRDDLGGPGKIRDFKKFFYHYCDLREGRMTLSEFLDIYSSIMCDISCTSAFGIADRLYNAISTESSLSFRAERRDSYPCFKTPIQTRFSITSPEQVPWIDKGSKPFVVGTSSAPKSQKNGRYRKPNPRSDLNDVI